MTSLNGTSPSVLLSRSKTNITADTAAASDPYVARGLVSLSVPQSNYHLLPSSTPCFVGRSQDYTSSARPGTLPHLRPRQGLELDHLATRPQTEREVQIPMPVGEFIRERKLCLEAALFDSISVRVEEKLHNGQTREAAWHTYWRHIGGERPSALLGLDSSWIRCSGEIGYP